MWKPYQLSRFLTLLRKKAQNKNLFLRPHCAINSPHVFHNSSSTNAVSISCLKSRGVIRLHGPDTTEFLQGLVTNDVHELMQQQHSLQYSFMLNVQGRVLHDLFFYNMTEKDKGVPTVFVDLHLDGVEEFMTLLKRYKLRRKVDITFLRDDFRVWAQFSPSTTTITPSTSQMASDPGLSDIVINCPDPRVPAFGRRFIRTNSAYDGIGDVDERVYTESRYKWGIPEGAYDLRPGSCFPLESNAILMNGVSFQKGCYIGQELTARTHHTGVTRKRIMPLVFESPPSQIERNVPIKTEKGRNAGKVLGFEGCFGLGLVRLLHVKDKMSVVGTDGRSIDVTTHFPHWWPEIKLD